MRRARAHKRGEHSLCGRRGVLRAGPGVVGAAGAGTEVPRGLAGRGGERTAAARAGAEREEIVGGGGGGVGDGGRGLGQVVVEEGGEQGKSVSVLSLIVTRAVDVPGTMISYSAQTRLAGRRRMLDMWWPRIRAAPGLRKVVSIRKGYGSEAYLFANGSMIMLASGTQTSDHGDTLHMAVIDEAWAQRDDTIEQAVKPAMMTIDGAQLWIVSTAGTEFSAYFRGKVDDGRAMAELGVTDTAAYFGYSAPDDADPGDPAAGYGCIPALGITVSEETVRADFATMPLAEFRRAYLCQWPEIAKPGWDVISQQAWAAAAG